MDRLISVAAHNLRSCHNVGSLLRTADCLGVVHVYLTGYTPYPRLPNDNRLPHLADKITRQIHKTALGSEAAVPISQSDDIKVVIVGLKQRGYTVCALEQTDRSQPLPAFNVPQRTALVVGRESEGLEAEILQFCDLCLEIPMLGTKESLNVVQAAAMALYHCRFI